jgi:hypothetical protein
MRELNCRDTCMVAYRQEVRMLDEELDGFEHDHVLRCDNEVADVVA